MTRPEPIIHPTCELMAPSGDAVPIDLEMVPLIQALWQRGFATLGCCQDSGEYAEAARAAKPGRTPTGNAGYIEYYRDWAWLKMPVQDTIRLADALTHTHLAHAVQTRWQRGSWRLNVPLTFDAPGGTTLAEFAQIYLPRQQITEVAAVLREMPSES